MKPVILGINNPHSRDPAKALATDPIGASGYRLWLMLKEAANRQGRDLSERDYMEGFDRRNLIDQKNYTNDQVRLRSSQILASLAGHRVVMCGTKVPYMLGLRYGGFDLVPRHAMAFVYWVIPHPSGLCRTYNDPAVREKVGNLLFKLWRD